MSVRKNSVLSEDRWADYPLDGRRRDRVDEVKRYLDKGLLTQDKVLERLTRSVLADVDPSTLACHFEKLADPSTGRKYITLESFTDKFRSLLQGSVEVPSSAVKVLFGVLRWYAAFPFPRPAEEVVDEAGFVRAVAMLSRPRPQDRSGDVTYDQVTGSLGPHSGWIVVARHVRAGEDWRRRIFRALAAPTPRLGGSTQMCTVAVPRFIVLEQVAGPPEGQVELSPDADDDWRDIVFMHDEDERTVDLRDVLAETSPIKHRISGRPMRESYDDVVASGFLPIQTPPLAELAVPRRSLCDFLTLLVECGGGRTDGDGLASSLRGWAQELGQQGDDGGLDWGTCNASLEKHEREFQEALAQVMSLLTRDDNI
ncbi:hypothetical protein MAPG_05061 [Magnaporthiopsis poae ATCC 64411]|uniref:Uncharacterized protein n=1 Tax=Magnaporthiopsis poae (strain ATCC 64411 / 73-15) TaxID=644358 RepID=A0A0C4DYE0_MAGP6|nr:hypothetical protein MAPG_05061 [Magnaporthiopsis poae ATCC 64411]